MSTSRSSLMRSRISGVMRSIFSGVMLNPASCTIGSRRWLSSSIAMPRMCSALSHTALGSKVSSGVVAGSLKFTTALARLIPSSENASTKFLPAHLLAIIFRRPAQQAQEIDERLGQESCVAIGGDAHDWPVAALRKLGPVRRDQQRKMRELRRREAGGFEDQHVLVGVRKMILAANDVADAQVGVVGARRQMIGRHAVGT